jgi:hypothetical protein
MYGWFILEGDFGRKSPENLVVIFQYGGHPDFHSRADDNIAL